MPKTTKSNKKTKQSGLRRRFNLTNKKVQFFVVVGIIGILGAGYFTVSSFAATTNIWDSAGLKCSQAPCGLAKDNIGTSDNKNVVNVYELGKFGQLTNRVNFSLSYQQTYRLCFDAKGSGQITTIGPDPIAFFNVTSSGTIAVTNSNAYVKYCSNNITNRSQPSGVYNAAFGITNTGSTNIRISKVSIDNGTK